MKSDHLQSPWQICGWITLTAAALCPRLLGYNVVPLWLDEAWRANVVLNDRWFAQLFDGSAMGSLTSIGYAVFVRILSMLGGTEGVLRCSSLITGMAAVLLVALVVQQATGSRLFGWLAGLVAAINPMFIIYAKELKPYSLELGVHLLLPFVALKYIEEVRNGPSERGRWGKICLMAGPVAAVASPNLVFLLPGWFMAVGLVAWRFSRQQVWSYAATAAVTAVLVAVQYHFSWSHASADSSLVRYWQDNFCSGGMPRLNWTVAQLNNMVLRAIDSTRTIFPARNEPFYIAVALLALVGAGGSISFREPSRFLLFVSPLLATVVANAMSLWPLGPIRVNLFLFGYLIVLVFLGGAQLEQWLGQLASPRMKLACHWGVAAMFVFYCSVAFMRVMPFARRLGPPNEDFPGALQALVRRIPEENGAGQRPLILVNLAASRALTYYTEQHPEFSRTLGAPLRNRAEVLVGDEAYSGPEAFKAIVARRGGGQPIWFLYSHYDTAALKELVAQLGETKGEVAVSGAGAIELVLRR